MDKEAWRACVSWGHKVRHDWATELNWTELPYCQSTLLILLSSTPFLWWSLLYSLYLCVYFCLVWVIHLLLFCLLVYILHMSESIEYLFFSDLFHWTEYTPFLFVLSQMERFHSLAWVAVQCVYLYIYVCVCVFIIYGFLMYLSDGS